MIDDSNMTWFDQLAGYALDALDPAETAEVEAHLVGCERCQAHLRWLEPAVAALPESVERQKPPKRVRENVMAEVRADAKRAQAESVESEGFHRREGWLGKLRSSAYGWKPAVALATLALLLVAFAGYQIGSNGGDGGSEAPIARSGQAPGVVAEMIPEGEGGKLRLTNVDQVPDDRVLEAWVQREGEVEAVPDLFVPNDEGRASTTIEDMDGVEIVMVTHEPEGGSATPTSDPIVTMPIPD